MLLVLFLGTFMASLDVSIVNVAAPAIGTDLSAGGAQLQIVVAGYSVAYGALLIVGARAGDDFGHRRMFLYGLAGFTLTSLAAGVAGSVGLLIAARIVQGAAAAFMMPQVLTLIQLNLEGAPRLKAIATNSAVIALAVVIGQIVGGALVTADLFGLGWRSIFLVNVPVGVVLLIAGARWLPTTRRATARPQDLVGTVWLLVALTGLFVPVVLGHELGWPVWAWILIAVSIIAAVVLHRHLHQVAAAGGVPLINLAVLRPSAVRYRLLAIGAMMMAYGGFLFTLATYLQRDLDKTAAIAGLVAAPYAAGFAITTLVGPRIVAVRSWVVPGLVVMGAGYWAVAASAGIPWLMIVLLVVTGAGFGLGYAPVIGAMLASVPPQHAHDGTGAFTTMNQIGYAFGVAVVGSLFLSTSGGAGGFAVAMIACGVLALVSAGAAASANRRRTNERANPDQAARRRGRARPVLR